MRPRTRLATVLTTALALGSLMAPVHATDVAVVPLADAGSLAGWAYDATSVQYLATCSDPDSCTPVADPAVTCAHADSDPSPCVSGFAYEPNTTRTVVPSSLTGRAVTAIAVSDRVRFALTADGRVTAWSTVSGDTSPLLRVPAGLSGVTGLCAGQDAIALKSNGTVVAWGSSTWGLTDIPPAIQGHVTKISCGSASVAMALLDNGTVVEWGDNSVGDNAPPAGLTGVVAITAPNDGDASLKITSPFMAIRSDGSLVTWGSTSTYNNGWSYGQFTVPEEVATASAAGTIAKAYSSAASGAVTLTTGRTIVWGYLTSADAPAAIPAEVTSGAGGGVVDLALNNYLSMALTADGHVYGWGAATTGGAKMADLMNTTPEALQGHVTAIAQDAVNTRLVITRAFALGTAPVLSGTARVGQKLHLTGATFSGADAPAVTTTWTTDTGVTLSAAGSDLTLTSALVGHTVKVTQVATVGSHTITTSAVSARIAAAPLPPKPPTTTPAPTAKDKAAQAVKADSAKVKSLKKKLKKATGAKKKKLKKQLAKATKKLKKDKKKLKSLS